MRTNPRMKTRGFTLIELLTVIAIIAILAAILIPVTSRIRESARRAQCVANLRGLGVLAHQYANDNNNRFPDNSGGLWAWDLNWRVVEALNMFGEDLREVMYCPSGDPQVEELWDFAPGQFRVIGYVVLFPGTPSVLPQYLNARLGAPPPYEEDREVVSPSLSQRELAVDTILSTMNGNFVDVRGDAETAHKTSHLASRGVPDGGNILFMDGHVKWRSFEEMKNRTMVDGTPYFWW